MQAAWRRSGMKQASLRGTPFALPSWRKKCLGLGLYLAQQRDQGDSPGSSGRISMFLPRRVHGIPADMAARSGGGAADS